MNVGVNTAQPDLLFYKELKHDYQSRHQRFWSYRPHGFPCHRQGFPRHRSGRHQRSARARLPGLHAEVRLRAWPLQRRRVGRRQQPEGQRQDHPPDRREGTREPEVERSWRRPRDRLHRFLPDHRILPGPHHGRRQEGSAVRPLEGRHPDVRVRRQPRQVCRRGHRLRRVLHHQLPGSRGQGAERQLGHQGAA